MDRSAVSASQMAKRRGRGPLPDHAADPPVRGARHGPRPVGRDRQRHPSVHRPGSRRRGHRRRAAPRRHHDGPPSLARSPAGQGNRPRPAAGRDGGTHRRRRPRPGRLLPPLRLQRRRPRLHRIRGPRGADGRGRRRGRSRAREPTGSRSASSATGPSTRARCSSPSTSPRCGGCPWSSSARTTSTPPRSPVGRAVAGSITARAAAFGIPAASCDGMDPELVYEATAAAVGRARRPGSRRSLSSSPTGSRATTRSSSRPACATGIRRR